MNLLLFICIASLRPYYSIVWICVCQKKPNSFNTFLNKLCSRYVQQINYLFSYGLPCKDGITAKIIVMTRIKRQDSIFAMISFLQCFQIQTGRKREKERPKTYHECMIGKLAKKYKINYAPLQVNISCKVKQPRS